MLPTSARHGSVPTNGPLSPTEKVVHLEHRDRTGPGPGAPTHGGPGTALGGWAHALHLYPYTRFLAYPRPLCTCNGAAHYPWCWVVTQPCTYTHVTP